MCVAASRWRTTGRPAAVVASIVLPPLRNRREDVPPLFMEMLGRAAASAKLDKVPALDPRLIEQLCLYDWPFNVRELIARVKVLFRRLALLRGAVREEPEQILCAGDLSLDLNRYQARWGDEPVPLTDTEFLILHALVRHPGHVKTRQQLIDEGYPHDTYVSDRTIDSHIKRLRKKLSQTAPGFSAIETIYGLGYRWREEEG